MSIVDWRPPIVEMMVAKQALADVDKARIFPWHHPSLAASLETVAAAEAALEATLDVEHRRFLTFADGWPGFYQSVDLLGTAALVAGPHRSAAFEAFEVAPEPLAELGLDVGTVLPIASSAVQADVFVMPLLDAMAQPQVHWIAEGEVVDSFGTFGQWFVSVIDLTKRRALKMSESAAG